MVDPHTYYTHTRTPIFLLYLDRDWGGLPVTYTSYQRTVPPRSIVYIESRNTATRVTDTKRRILMDHAYL